MSASEAEQHFLTIGLQENRECNKHNMYYNKQMIEEWKGWYNHHEYSKRGLHFLSVMKRETLNKVGGFCNELKGGLWFEDNDFKDRISRVCKIKIVDSEKYVGIHQYHISGTNETIKTIDTTKSLH